MATQPTYCRAAATTFPLAFTLKVQKSGPLALHIWKCGDESFTLVLTFRGNRRETIIFILLLENRVKSHFSTS